MAAHLSLRPSSVASGCGLAPFLLFHYIGALRRIITGAGQERMIHEKVFSVVVCCAVAYGLSERQPQ
jgi:hypothetical protein